MIGMVIFPGTDLHGLLVETAGNTGGYPWVRALEDRGGHRRGDSFVWPHEALEPAQQMELALVSP